MIAFFVALQNLPSLDLRYVGLIGPRKRHNQLLNELLDLGVTIILQNRKSVAKFPFPKGRIDIDTAANYASLTKAK